MSRTYLTFGDIGGKLHMLQIECAGIARRCRTWHAALCVARLDLSVGEDLWGTFGVGGNWVLPAYAATAGEKSSFTTRLEPAR